MSTIRVSKTRDYSVVSNYAANDKSLSWKAKGILYYLLTKPDSWTVNRENIVHMATDGDTSVRTALCELEASGYLRRSKVRLPNGKFEWESVLYEEPKIIESHIEKPYVGNPPMVKPPVDKTPLVNTDVENTYSVYTEEYVEGEELVPKSTIIEPLPVARKVNLGRDTQERERCIEELYKAYRFAISGMPENEPINDLAYGDVKRYFSDLHVKQNATPAMVRKVTAKLLRDAKGEVQYVTAKTVASKYDTVAYTLTAKTPTTPHSAPPPPTPTITEIDETPYTEEQHLALRKSMWDAMWIERKHAASNGYFPDYQERIAYDASTDAQKAQSRAQGYVDGFCPVFDEYLAEI